MWFTNSNCGEVRAEYFDADLSAMPQTFSDIDGGHAARAEFPLDAVPVGEGSIQSSEIAHSRALASAISYRLAAAPPEVRRLLLTFGRR